MVNFGIGRYKMKTENGRLIDEAENEAKKMINDNEVDELLIKMARMIKHLDVRLADIEDRLDILPDPPSYK